MLETEDHPADAVNMYVLASYVLQVWDRTEKDEQPPNMRTPPAAGSSDMVEESIAVGAVPAVSCDQAPPENDHVSPVGQPVSPSQPPNITTSDDALS